MHSPRPGVRPSGPSWNASPAARAPTLVRCWASWPGGTCWPSTAAAKSGPLIRSRRRPTPIQVTWEGGPRVYAMCAIDALGMSAMLDRPVIITAREPGGGRPVTVEVDRNQARWRPRGTVVFSGAAGDADGACCASADRTCGFINFFTSARAAREWASRHPEVIGTTLDQAQALRHGIAEFGTLMHAVSSLTAGPGSREHR
jgi:hypothetical protein